MLLAAIVILGVAVQTITVSASHEIRKDREAGLIFRGVAYRNAIKSYYLAGKPRRTYPRELDQLLQDRRFPTPKKHIRALYSDPLGGGKEWTLISASDGGFRGVASQSRREPIKKANFPPGLEPFEEARTYADWIFEYNPVAQAPVKK